MAIRQYEEHKSGGNLMKLLLVYNPMSGKAKIKNCLHEIIDVFIRAGYTVTVHATQEKGRATA